MAKYESVTIKELINKIEAGQVILPAMQRNFVWSESKICTLFDSLMRDYPIGTFLFWKIDQELFNKYVFNGFIKDYDEQLGKNQRGKPASAIWQEYHAVLDGQQRLTALYMGIRGKYRTHIKGKKWENPENYFDRFLCIDIMFIPNKDEEYRFQFVPEEKIGHYETGETGRKEFWVKVSQVVETELEDIADIIELIPEDSENFPLEKRTKARKILLLLNKALNVFENVSYYLAKERELSEVVDVFTRVNNGGEKLTPSELMLSIATGEQDGADIHVKVQDAVKEINNTTHKDDGFKVDRDMILTASLLFMGADNLSLKNSENYAPARMNEIFEEHWDEIVDALKCTVDYVEYLGFTGKKLGRNNVLSIAYYFYKNRKEIKNSHKRSSSKRASCDRIFIRQWLLRAIINGVFKEGTGSTVLAIRKVIDRSLKKHFPLEDLMDAEIKASLKIGEEEIEEILDIQYGDPRIVPLFNELEHVAAKENVQVDHMWARAILSSKKAIKDLYPSISNEKINEYKSQLHRLANLQLLDVLENNEKLDTPFDKWLSTKYADEQSLATYRQSHFIPVETTYNFAQFLEFIKHREDLLKQKIREAFPSEFDQLVARYGLQDKLDG